MENGVRGKKRVKRGWGFSLLMVAAGGSGVGKDRIVSTGELYS